jgi:hypothetical protein
LARLFSVILLLGALVARDFMVQDHPPAIRNRYGPKSLQGRGVTFIAAINIVL